MLRRGGYVEAADDPEKLRQDLSYARNWVQDWAPESYAFGVRDEVPPEAASLDIQQRRYLSAVAGRLEDGMDGDAAQNLLYSAAGEFGLKPKAAFGAIYTVLLGKKSGHENRYRHATRIASGYRRHRIKGARLHSGEIAARYLELRGISEEKGKRLKKRGIPRIYPRGTGQGCRKEQDNAASFGGDKRREARDK